MCVCVRVYVCVCVYMCACVCVCVAKNAGPEVFSIGEFHCTYQLSCNSEIGFVDQNNIQYNVHVQDM